ncbi:hypothetical protein EGX98_10730 [Fusobacterium necrophorum]|nr:hypothetical protein EGX98_10730 [Fusobacterium necrophorum]
METEIQKVLKKDTFSKILHATLTKDSCACPHCNSLHTVKNSFKTSMILCPFPRIFHTDCLILNGKATPFSIPTAQRIVQINPNF